MSSDGFSKYLRTQIHITEDQLAAAKSRDVAASKDGSGSGARHTVLRKRGALITLKLVLRAYQDFKGWRR